MEIRACQFEKRSWIEVDLNQLRKNYHIYKAIIEKNISKDINIMAVVKADAYGCGDVIVAKTLQKEGVKLFAVSNIDEAVTLRKSGIVGEIFILGYTDVKYSDVLVRENIVQTLVSEEHARAFYDVGSNVKCQIAIDTGMNRIGIDADDILESERIIRTYAKKLNLCGVFTHFSVADDETVESVEFTNGQIHKFQNVLDKVKDVELSYIHCYNSAGGLFHLGKNEELNSLSKIIRLGIVLYGLKPDNKNTLPDGIEPVLTWKTTVSMVKTLEINETIGYGRTYKSDCNRTIATITTGYADGYDRHFSNRWYVLIHGKKAPIVGNICMDQMMVDVTNIPETKMGDEVVLIGKSGNEVITADAMAANLQTIGYEIICGISHRVQRTYIE